MSDDNLLKTVKKFDGSNFQAWKFRLNTILVAHAMQDVVNGTRAMPADAGSDAGKKWVKDNAKAMCFMSSSVKDSQLECLLNCTTAKEMWDKLCRIHEQKSEANKLLLLQKFHGYRMDLNESVVQHVSCIQNMATQLTDVGEAVSDAAIIAKVLGSLPSRYNALQTAWDSVPVENQSLENLLERLIKEEKKLEGDEDVTSALAAVSLGGKAKKNIAASAGKNSAKSRDSDKTDVECF